MVMKYPAFLALIAVLVVLVVLLVRFGGRGGAKYDGGRRVANTSLVKSDSGYSALMWTRVVATGAIALICVAAFVIGTILMSRPMTQREVSIDENRKDIMVCLDVSSSLVEQNRQIVDTMRDVVANLDGERVGVVVFNTTAVLDVPLTDNYDYVLAKLDDIEEFLAALEYDQQYGGLLPGTRFDSAKVYSYLYGTTMDSETRGSSLIGDGLGTALYSFPHLEDDDDRTRVIVLSTDNDQLAGDEPPIMELQEAADACVEHGVSVMALFPANLTTIGKLTGITPEQAESDLRLAAEKTGGKLYEIGASGNPSIDVVAAINDLDAGHSEGGQTVLLSTDKPEGFFIALLLLACVAAVMKARWRS